MLLLGITQHLRDGFPIEQVDNELLLRRGLDWRFIWFALSDEPIQEDIHCRIVGIFDGIAGTEPSQLKGSECSKGVMPESW
jgi:hypothetical protein